MRLILSLLMGVVVLALAGAGVFVYAVDFYSRDLPDYTRLASYEPPVTTRVHAGDGRLMAEFAAERRVFVPIAAIPKHVSQAFISAEDKNFYEHRGVDPVGIARAIVTNLEHFGSSRRLVGASTITQQVAKNMLLSNEVSITRKLREAILAVRIERTLSKERILELYLNEIFLGFRAYGVAAAAQNYFGKSLDELTIAECAFLGALPKAPANYHPEKRHDAAVARRDWVISRMAEDGYITKEEETAARAEPLTIRARPEGETTAQSEWFAEEVRREIVKLYGERALYEGGLSVRASMDPTLQQVATRALRNGLIAYDRRHGFRGPVARMDNFDTWAKKLAATPQPGGPDSWRLAVVLKDDDPKETQIGLADGSRGHIPLAELKWARASKDDDRLGPEIKKPADALKLGDVILVEAVAKDDKGKDYPPETFGLRQVPAVQGGMAALDPHTGRVLAMVGGFAPSTSGFNRAVQAMRQPGSSFKPFVYLTALENGFTPSSLVLDGPFEYDPGRGQPIWRPGNFGGGYSGPMTLRQGIEKSRNLMTVRLAAAIGMDKVKTTAEAFGVVDELKPYLPMALGAQETTVLRMVTAYGMLANGGKRIVPTFIDRVQDRTGKTVFRHDDRRCDGCSDVAWSPGLKVPPVPDSRDQVADARFVYQIVSIMEGVVQRGTAAKLASLGKPLAGKTGTTNDSMDAWFVGYSPDLVVGTYLGFDQPRSLGETETGGSSAVPVAKEFLETALKDASAKPFRIPPGLSRVRVNPLTGDVADPGDKRAIWESYIPGTEPVPGETRPVLDGSGRVGGEGGWADSETPGSTYGSVLDMGTPAPAASPAGAPVLGAPTTAPAVTANPAAPRPGTSATEGTGGIY